MGLQYEKVTIATAADGSATVRTSRPVNGELLGIYYEIGTLDVGGDITVTEEQSGAPIDTVTNIAASQWRKPAIPVVASDGTAALYAAGGEAVRGAMPVHGQIKFVVASGGASKTGYAHVYSRAV